MCITTTETESTFQLPQPFFVFRTQPQRRIQTRTFVVALIIIIISFALQLLRSAEYGSPGNWSTAVAVVQARADRPLPPPAKSATRSLELSTGWSASEMLSFRDDRDPTPFWVTASLLAGSGRLLDEDGVRRLERKDFSPLDPSPRGSLQKTKTGNQNLKHNTSQGSDLTPLWGLSGALFWGAQCLYKRAICGNTMRHRGILWCHVKVIPLWLKR